MTESKGHEWRHLKEQSSKDCNTWECPRCGTTIGYMKDGENPDDWTPSCDEMIVAESQLS